jgi:nitroreductase
MNATIERIQLRKSQRVYANKPIGPREKKIIIQSAMRAPTAGNMMLYSILEVTDPEHKRQLVNTCDNQPFIAKAPLVLIFLADMQRWLDYYTLCRVPEYCDNNGLKFARPQESDLLLCCCDALIAAQTAALAAESMDIGSCYIGDIIENIEIHREMFDLPPLVFPIAMLCFGYCRESEKTRAVTSRFPSRFIHFKDRYRRLTPTDFEGMFRQREAEVLKNKQFCKNVANLGQHFYLKKTGTAFSEEMRRSVKVALRDWQGD